jgi:hypothetical protein
MQPKSQKPGREASHSPGGETTPSSGGSRGAPPEHEQQRFSSPNATEHDEHARARVMHPQKDHTRSDRAHGEERSSRR